MGLVGGAARLADTRASHSKQAAQLSRGLLCLLCACRAEGLGFVHGNALFRGWVGILVELSMKSACFMDGGSVLVCLSMKSLDFMDGRGFEEGFVHGSALFRGWVGDFGGVVHEIRLFHG